jgi:hypothetical protein
MTGPLPAAFLGLQLLVPVADGVPRLPVEATCRAVAKADPASGDDVCLRAERSARADLSRSWSEFDRATRTRCTQEATMGGFASYVELITCLEVATGRFKRPDGAPAAPLAGTRAPRRNGESAPNPAAPASRPD